MISEAEISEYVTKAAALVGGHALDSLVLSVPSSRASTRSYVEHARCIADSKGAPELVIEVWGHVEDIIATATADGRSEVVFRINLFRAKQPSGSRTWRADTGPGGGREDEDEIGSTSTLAGALVAGMKEMRLALRDSLAMVGASAAEGWRMASESMKAERKAQEDKTELMIALNAQEEQKEDPMRQIAAKAASEFIDFTKIKAVMAMQEEAAEKARLSSYNAIENKG